MRSDTKPVVLAVDDEPAYIYMIKDLLEQENFNVISATSGYEALNTIQEAKPNVVLLDLVLPDINGISVLEKILADEETKDIPVIVILRKLKLKMSNLP